MALARYYHKKDLTPELLAGLQAVAKEYDTDYMVLCRSSNLALFPEDKFVPKAQRCWSGNNFCNWVF